MRSVLVDGHVLDGISQGSASYLAGLYRSLSKRTGIRIYVACRLSESLDRYGLRSDNIGWIKTKTNNKYYRLSIDMDRVQRLIKPSFAHFTYFTPVTKRCPFVCTIHDVLFLDFPELFSKRFVYRNALFFFLSAARSDLIFTISQYSASSLIRWLRVPKQKVVVTPCAGMLSGDTVEVPVEGLNPGEFIVFVSRIEPRKNQHRLIDAFAAARSVLPNNSKLVLVGAYASRYPEFDKALARSNEFVVWKESVAEAQLIWLYKNAAGCFYPSLAEGFGLPIIEACALGGSSYCSNTTAMRELRSLVTGNFDPYSISELRASVIHAFGNIRQSQYSSSGIEYYNWDRAAEIYYENTKSFCGGTC